MYAWVLLAALAAVALADWFAVATGRRGVEQVAKPAYVVLLGAFAWLLHAERAAATHRSLRPSRLVRSCRRQLVRRNVAIFSAMSR